METIIIRKAAVNLYIVMVLGILCFILFIYLFSESFVIEMVSKSFVIVMVIIFSVLSIFPIWLFVYGLRELIKKTPQITLTQEGLQVKGRDFYPWEKMDDFAFSMEKVGSDNAGNIYKNFITLSFLDGTAAKFTISHLDRKADDIMYLLGEYKRRSDEERLKTLS